MKKSKSFNETSKLRGSISRNVEKQNVLHSGEAPDIPFFSETKGLSALPSGISGATLTAGPDMPPRDPNIFYHDSCIKLSCWKLLCLKGNVTLGLSVHNKHNNLA